MRDLLGHHPQLRPNFKNSVFACATFNFGPATCTLDHRDCANLPFGLCSITSLGSFNPRTGGHLVLWDLRLVIEFPPGSTAIIPSATLRHSNTEIGPDEERFSFTQYTAGGIFRWVDQGFQPSPEYYSALDVGAKAAFHQRAAARWKEGISLFSTLEELRADSGA
ncbi:uncharacterized protein B0H18DRAFT_1086404 [Fomitopsis serialis]|uniref:uncharacterized protein n=1 Tax=Fomitopsis serialis TaxID=139415 RepID=UPI002008172B|nr:uncharacterized protein B0H18DRAFT_1086404 [Neoantrodia serialis]KAH9920385.1 hypothetical protein B0H18DRAFT_1086404 [Neoantrodia serialis]